MDNRAYNKEIRKQAKAMGKVVILWGDLESLMISLDMMKVGEGRYRPRTEAELKGMFPRRRERFEDVTRRALKGLEYMRRRVLAAKNMRDAIVHGVTMGVSKNSSEATVPLVVNVDAVATVFAQRWPVTRMVIPKQGPILRIEDVSRLGTNLQTEVEIMRTFQAVIRAANREVCMDEVDKVEPAPGTSKFVQETSGANPAWTVGRNDQVGEFVGEFVMVAATLERALRTLELMHIGKRWKDFETIEGTDLAVQRMEERSRKKSITSRFRKILKRKPALKRRTEEFFRYRNFVLHNPLSATGREEDGVPAFVDRRLVAVRDATLVEWEKQKELKMVPQWAWDRQQGKGLVYASMQSLANQKTMGRQLIQEINNLAYEATKNPLLRTRDRVR